MIIGTASELGYINIPESTLIDIDHLKELYDRGYGTDHNRQPGRVHGGTVPYGGRPAQEGFDYAGRRGYFKFHPDSGNEKAVARVINELSMKGAEVINQDTHVSGHACQEEIKLMYSLVRPKFSIPVHGEYRHLMAQRNWQSQWAFRRKMSS